MNRNILRETKEKYKSLKELPEKVFSGQDTEHSDVYNAYEKRSRNAKINRWLADKKHIKIVYISLVIFIYLVLIWFIYKMANTNFSTLITEGKVTYKNGSLLLIIWQTRVFGIIYWLLTIPGYFMFKYKMELAFGDLMHGAKGMARWSSREEIEAQYKKIPDRDLSFPGKGGIPIARDGDYLYIDTDPVNNLIIGTSRSGKGEETVFPSIDIYSRAEEKASMVITDPKLELAAASIPTLTERGYDCFVLNLIDPEYSMFYNPLSTIIEEYKLGNKSTAQALSRSLAYNIIINDPNEKDPFWSDQARNVLIAGIMAEVHDCLLADKILNQRLRYRFEANERRKKKYAINKLQDEDMILCYYIKDAAKEALSIEVEEIDNAGLLEIIKEDVSLPEYISKRVETLSVEEFEGYLNHADIDLDYTPGVFIPSHENEEKIHIYSVVRMISNLYGTMTRDADGKEVRAIDSFFNERDEGDFSKITYNAIGSASDNTKGTIMSMFASKVAIFTYDNIGRMMSKNSLKLLDVGFGKKPIAVFIALPDYDSSNWFIATVFINQLYFTLAKMATAMPSGRTVRDVIFLLDEFGNLPPLDNMESLVSVCLGRGIKFNFVIQAFSQLDAKYGNETATTIRNNCGNWKYILTTDDNTAELISKALAEETFTVIERSGKMLSLNKNYQEQNINKPLLFPHQLKSLTEGETVVLRYLKRKDNDGEAVRAHPIPNLGKNKMKFRYQYLLDTFPSNRLLYTGRNLYRILENNPDIKLSDMEIAEGYLIKTTGINLDDISRSTYQYLKDYNLRTTLICDYVRKAQDGQDKINSIFDMTMYPEEKRAKVLSGRDRAFRFTVNDYIIYSKALMKQPEYESIGHFIYDVFYPINYDRYLPLNNIADDEDLELVEFQELEDE